MEAGTASGYHASTYGNLVGELVRRVSGKSLKEFVAKEIAGPLGADFQIGAREQDWHRMADVVPPPPLVLDMSTLDRESIGIRTLAASFTDAMSANTSGWRCADLGAANGHGNAASVARILSVVTLGGEVDGVRLLSGDTIDLICDEQSNHVDLVLGIPLRWGIGYGLPERQSVASNPEEDRIYFLGWLGRLHDHDGPGSASAVSYIMNKMAPGILGSTRSESYLGAVYDAMG